MKSGTEESPIEIVSGGNDDEYICRVMDLLYANLFTLSNGNSVIGTVKNKNDGEKFTYLYTPLLPVKELEKYCKKNYAAYCVLVESNKDELEVSGVLVMPSDFYLLV